MLAVKRWFIGALIATLGVSALPSCRSIYYNFWETFGKEKRDLLRDSIAATTDRQQELRQEFKDTLERIRHEYKFDGGKLEQTYDKLTSDYERAKHKAEQLLAERRELALIAKDLFKEWRQEAVSINDVPMRRDSLSKLTKAQDRFKAILDGMVQVEKKLTKVLASMRDHQLYLKHNLNAQAVTRLKQQMSGIEQEITKLIGEISRSIAESESFSKTLAP